MPKRERERDFESDEDFLPTKNPRIEEIGEPFVSYEEQTKNSYQLAADVSHVDENEAGEVEAPREAVSVIPSENFMTLFEKQEKTPSRSNPMTFYVVGGVGFTVDELRKMSKTQKNELRERQLMGFRLRFLPDIKIELIQQMNKEVNEKFIRSLGIPVTNLTERAPWYELKNGPVAILKANPDVSFSDAADPFSLEYAQTYLTGEDEAEMADYQAVAFTEGVEVIDVFASQMWKGEFNFDAVFAWVDDKVKEPFNIPGLHRIGQYNPSYRVSERWTVPESAIINSEQLGFSRPQVQRCLDCMALSTNTYVLTNGSLKGQFNRLKDTWRVAREVASRVPLDRRVKADFNTVLGKTWNARFQRLDLDALHESLIILDPAQRNFVINRVADAGPAWPVYPKVERKSVILTDVVYANKILQYVMSIQSEEQWSNFKTTLLTQAIVRVKPKWEVMKRSKIGEKVRNICVFSSYAQVHLGMFLTPFNHLNNIALDSNCSLKGFLPVYGHVQIVLDRLYKQKIYGDRFSMCFYSDNVYILDKEFMILFSMDVEKMESTSSSEEADAIMAYILAGSGVRPDSYLGKYLRLLAAEFGHYSTGVLGPVLVQIPGMSTGSQSTFIINHGRMAYAANTLMQWVLQDNGKRLLACKSGSKLDVDAPLPFNLELTWRSDVGREAVPAIYLPSGTGVVGLSDWEVSAAPLDKFGPIIVLDILGTVGVPVVLPTDHPDVKVLGSEFRIISALDFERTMRAVMYRKINVKIKTLLSGEAGEAEVSVGANALSLMTLSGLYITGGYAFAETDQVIRSSAALLVTQLIEGVQTLKLSLAGDVKSEKTEEGIVNVLKQQILQALSGDEEAMFDVDTAELLAYQVLIMATSDKQMESWKKFFDRTNVIMWFHTPEGRQIRDDLKKERLRQLATKGGSASRMGHKLSAHVDQVKVNINVAGFGGI